MSERKKQAVSGKDIAFLASGKTARCGLLLALSLILGYVEAMVPINIGIPGVKLGIPNVVTVIGLYSLGILPTAIITICRILLISVSFGNAMTLSYSLSGFFLSFAGMLLLKSFLKLRPVTVSAAGGVLHNIGQLAASVFLLHTRELVFYLPVLLIAGIISGCVTGILAGLVTERIRIFLRRIP